MKINDYGQLKSGKVLTTLHDVSLDDSNRSDKHYMTDSTAIVTNFDLVKREYMKALHISEDNAKSVDALFQVTSTSNDDPDVCMVEFKNGEIDSRDIERKARDSVLFFNRLRELS